MASGSSQAASAQAAATAGDSNIDARLRRSPLWRHVKVVEKNGTTGGNARSQCLYCNHMIPGSYSRVRAHLLKEEGKGVGICSHATQEMVDMFRREEEAAKAATQANMARTVPLPVHLTVPSGLPSGARTSKRKRQTGISESFHHETRQMADALIARMFYTGGLPFNLARNPNYREAFNFVATNDLGGYVPPGIKKMRTTLLQQERANVDRLLEPIKSTWNHKGVTIAADGWTDAQRRPLINFIAITESGPMFLKCENTEGKAKTKEYIAELLTEIIEKIGSKNVVQVITDNAANCKGAGLIIEAKYDNIFWTPCVVHTLNLALKSICAPRNGENFELEWIGDVAGHAAQIKNFIMNHGMRLSMFNSFSKLKFLAVADTRFASVIVMLKRFLHLKDALERMVISDKWAAYKEDDQEKASFVRATLLDEAWWGKVKYIVDFTEPIYSMLRAADTDKPCLHLMYEMWDSMIEKVKAVIYHKEGKGMYDESDFFEAVSKILHDRWLKSNTPLHCLAHSLVPRYYTEQWLAEVPNRVFPHGDPEISELRNACLKKFFPIPEDLRKVKQQFADFSQNRGIFAAPDSIDDRVHFADPLQWWGTYGSGAPELKKLASKLLGQPASSSCCERNWSTYGFIASLRRNKLTPERAEDLVFVHNNLRLFSRSTAECTSGPSHMWDVGGDGYDTFDGVGILQAADLSLDEPEFEVMITEDEEP